MNVAEHLTKKKTNETAMKMKINEAEQGYSFEVHVSEEKLMLNI